jgi:hypothetical protein
MWHYTIDQKLIWALNDNNNRNYDFVPRYRPITVLLGGKRYPPKVHHRETYLLSLPNRSS